MVINASCEEARMMNLTIGVSGMREKGNSIRPRVSVSVAGLLTKFVPYIRSLLTSLSQLHEL